MSWGQVGPTQAPYPTRPQEGPNLLLQPRLEGEPTRLPAQAPHFWGSHQCKSWFKICLMEELSPLWQILALSLSWWWQSQVPPCRGDAEGLRGCCPYCPVAHGPILPASSSHCLLGTSRAAEMCFGVKFDLVCSLFAMVLRIRPVGDSPFLCCSFPLCWWLGWGQTLTVQAQTLSPPNE